MCINKNSESEKKHAYLIVAHNEIELLEKLVELLDYQDNDLYIHVDKKVRFFNKERLRNKCRYSQIYFIKRMKVSWGGDTQIQCTLELLRAAVAKKYIYYHLISGVDLPLKTPKAISDFFRVNEGTEYISIEERVTEDSSYLKRIKYYYLGQNIIGKNNNMIKTILKIVQRSFVILQKIIKIDRTEQNEDCYYKGENWFSITHQMAVYILGQEKYIKRFFYKSICGDELFIQTVAQKSPYAENINGISTRHIDWNKGKPYTFRMVDYEELYMSSKLFARKFSSTVDDRVIESIYTRLLHEKMQEEES